MPRFCSYLIAALQNIYEGVGRSAQGLLREVQMPSTRTVMTTLANDISALPNDFVLVLDDYHVIDTKAIHDTLDLLLEHQPLQMHLVLVTRSDPPLYLARLRGSDQLVEIRSNELRFTVEETAEFLNHSVGLNLPQNAITMLEQSTEGWIAGLQMAAISMRGREDLYGFITSFGGSHRFLMDYLTEEVLERQPEPMRTFLVKTALLERMTGPLCDALTGRTDGAERLEQAVSANLFVTPLDDERRWYRYHPLFAELLRNRLLREHPGAEEPLHRNASEWFEQQDMIPEAMSHAFAANDLDRAVRLIEDNGLDLVMRGNALGSTLKAWLDKLPDQLVRSRPRLAMNYCWALGLTQGPSATGLVELVAVLRGDRSSGDLIQQARELASEDNLLVHAFANGVLGNQLRRIGDVEGALHAFTESVRQAQALSYDFLAMFVLAWLAELHRSQDHLRLAFKTCQQALRLSDHHRRRGPQETLFGPTAVYLVMADVLCEWNDIGAAESYLLDYVDPPSLREVPPVYLAGHIVLARIRRAQGDFEGAFAALERAEQLLQEYGSSEYRGLVEYFRAELTAFKVRLLLAQGKLPSTIPWEGSPKTVPPSPVTPEYFAFPPSFIHLPPLQGTTVARVLLAQGKLEEALALLKKLRHKLKARTLMGTQIEILSLEALALRAQGHDDQAMSKLEEALALAQPEGYLRCFLDEGRPMLDLLNLADSQGMAPNYMNRLLDAFHEEGTVAEDQEHSVEIEGGPEGEGTPAIQPLSRRELEVLRLVAAGLSNREAAETLFVSEGAIKKHLNNIFGKLSVGSRTQAVARARGLKLLS
jgi:LuxR family maltose regulon positive regulatory protein